MGKILGIFMGRLAEKREAREKEEKLTWTGRRIEAEVERGVEKEIQAEVEKEAKDIIKSEIRDYMATHKEEIKEIIAKRVPKII